MTYVGGSGGARKELRGAEGNGGERRESIRGVDGVTAVTTWQLR